MTKQLKRYAALGALILGGCGEPGMSGDWDGPSPTDLWPEGPTASAVLGPPGDLDLCQPPFLIPGESVFLVATGAEAGETVTFVRGTGTGPGLCPAALGGQCLDVVNARVLGSAVADADGEAILVFSVPATAPVGVTVTFQAVAPRGDGGVDSALSFATTGAIDASDSGRGQCDEADVCATPDSDADGVHDRCDACPLDNPDDVDLDGVCDSDDLCAAGDDTVDSDSDGVPDACDPCPSDFLDDSDFDSVCDSEDVCPGSDDTIDSDSDTVPDACDPCPLDNPDDTDGDGVCDSVDQCAAGDDLVDTDFNGVPDACEPFEMALFYDSPFCTIAVTWNVSTAGTAVITLDPAGSGADVQINTVLDDGALVHGAPGTDSQGFGGPETVVVAVDVSSTLEIGTGTFGTALGAGGSAILTVAGIDLAGAVPVLTSGPFCN